MIATPYADYFTGSPSHLITTSGTIEYYANCYYVSDILWADAVLATYDRAYWTGGYAGHLETEHGVTIGNYNGHVAVYCSGNIATVGVAIYVVPGIDPVNPQPGDGNTREPINFISGNNHFPIDDIRIQTAGIPLDFTRYYNSAATNTTVLGAGWRHSYDWSLAIKSNSATIIAGDAREYTFLKNPGGDYRASFDSNWQLIKQTNDEYTLLLPGAVAYRFDTNGVLQKISDGWSNTVSLLYSNSLLVSVEQSTGQSLDMSYSNGLLSAVTAATNLTVTYEYNPAGVLASSLKQAGTESFLQSYAYDFSLRLTQRVDSVGSDYYYTYDESSGNATGMYLTDDRWYEHSVSYSDSSHRQVSYYRAGETLSQSYEIDSTIKRINEENFNIGTGTGRVVFAYDGNGNTTSKTTYDADTNHWTQINRRYDGWHNVTNEAFGLSATPTNITKYSWHPQWQVLTSITDPEGFKQEYEYTNGVIAKKRIYLSGNTTAETKYSYTTNGLLAAITNANGHSTAFTYDTLGYPHSIIPQAGPTATFGYDSLGHLTNSALPGGRQVGYTVNPLGWVERIDYADTLYETFQYDGLGDVTNHVDRAERVTSYTYAPSGKLTGITRQLGSTNVTVFYDFDQQFNTLAIRDELGRPVESYALDPQDRPTTVTNLEGQMMSIRYLVGNFVDSITRFDNTVVSNQYTGDGRLTAVHYPDETNHYTYLRNGLVQTLENSGGMVSNAWNSASWLTSVASSTSVSSVSSMVSYSYDPVGNVTNAAVFLNNPAPNNLTTFYSYDEAERLTSISTALTPSTNLTFQYSYNPDNGLVASVSNANVCVEYQYDIMDRIQYITWKDLWGGTLIAFDYQYNAAGMITNRVVVGIVPLPGVSTAYQYDDLDRLIGEVSSAGSASLRGTSYFYDVAGNRLAKQNSDSMVSYTLDDGNRQASWSAASTNDFLSTRILRVQGYSSETIGTDNRWGHLYVSNSMAVTPDINGTNFSIDAFTVGLGTQTVVAAIRDQAGNMGYATNQIFLSVITNGAYQYNAAGCVTNITYTGFEHVKNLSLGWNSQYQLINVDEAFDLVQYGYNVSGRRVSRTNGTNVEQYVYDGNQVDADIDAEGTLLRSYIWGSGIDNLLALTVYTNGATNTYYALTDQQGTVHALVDGAGTIAERYDYDAWGRTTVFDATGTQLTESAIGNRYCFQGREIDWTTGLYYFRARWYNPVVGRWLSKDPIGISGGLNQYVFCANNPVNFRDPWGDFEFYGNWGGPNWSGGRDGSYEDLSPAEIAANPPVDSMDELFFNHDKAYAEARSMRNKLLCDAKTEEDKSAANDLFEQLRQHADDILFRELDKLPLDPAKWARPASDPGRARRARSQAKIIFNFRRYF